MPEQITVPNELQNGSVYIVLTPEQTGGHKIAVYNLVDESNFDTVVFARGMIEVALENPYAMMAAGYHAISKESSPQEDAANDNEKPDTEDLKNFLEMAQLTDKTPTSGSA